MVTPVLRPPIASTTVRVATVHTRDRNKKSKGAKGGGGYAVEDVEEIGEAWASFERFSAFVKVTQESGRVKGKSKPQGDDINEA